MNIDNVRDENASNQIITQPDRHQLTPETSKTFSSLKVATLGGCSTNEIGKRLEPLYFKHSRHVWRRPTISLMSQNEGHIKLDSSELSGDYVKYLTGEITGDHLRDIVNIDSDALIFDFTRDIHMGVMQIEPGRFISNPIDSRGIVEGLPSDTNFDEIKLRKIFGYQGDGIFSWNENSELFLDLWKHHYIKFIEAVQKNYKSIRLVKLYFTDRKLGETETVFGDGTTFPTINNILREMYAFSDRIGVESVSINEKYYISDLGNEVPAGGPEPTHYINETYAMLVEEISASLLGRRYFMGRRFIPQAFSRANREAERRKEIKSLQTKYNAIIAERDAALTELHELKFAAKDTDSLGSPSLPAQSWHWPAAHLLPGASKQIGDELVMSNCAGLISYGPYIDLPSGGYWAHVQLGRLVGTGELTLWVTTGSGSKRISTLTWNGDQPDLIQFPFFLGSDGAQQVEVLVSSEGYDLVTIVSLEIHRQRE